MTKPVELYITSDPSLLRMMRTVLSHICESIGFSCNETNKIVLAVDEACTNIIRHAYKNKYDQPIIITCNFFPDKLEIVIVDYGEPADAKKIKPRKLDEFRPGGLGVYLMTSVMDEVKFYNGTKDGNRLIMIKNLPKEEKICESGNHY